jgi:hypothetical protein
MTTPATLRRPRGWIRDTPLWWLALPAAWAGYVLTYDPTDRIGEPTGPCQRHMVFGIDGPTCGITRMTWYLLHRRASATPSSSCSTPWCIATNAPVQFGLPRATAPWRRLDHQPGAVSDRTHV